LAEAVRRAEPPLDAVHNQKSSLTASTSELRARQQQQSSSFVIAWFFIGLSSSLPTSYCFPFRTTVPCLFSRERIKIAILFRETVPPTANNTLVARARLTRGTQQLSCFLITEIVLVSCWQYLESLHIKAPFYKKFRRFLVPLVVFVQSANQSDKISLQQQSQRVTAFEPAFINKQQTNINKQTKQHTIPS